MCSGLEIVTGIRSTISVNVEIPFLICGGEKGERGVGEKRGGGGFFCFDYTEVLCAIVWWMMGICLRLYKDICCRPVLRG